MPGPHAADRGPEPTRPVAETEEQTTFQSLGVSEATLASVQALGWTVPTPIQRKAIPAARHGQDIVGIAQTGTGKTGAFMIPALERIRAGEGLQALVLCPTRELAQQVAEDAEALARGTRLRVRAIFGGVSYGPQNKALQEGWEVVVATPGRFIDHMRRGKIKLKSVRFCILDEADRMLDMGFRPQIEEILKALPEGRQTMLFSATMPNGVHDLALRVTSGALWLEAAPSGTTASGISEVAYSVKPERKPDLLVELLKDAEWDHVLVFSRTKAGADVLDSRLQREGIKADVMHSSRDMKERTRALDQFAKGKIRVLVATDIAQRGLDVEGISHVVNYDVPLDPEDYVHRVGRTGRAGALGTAVTFVTAGDLGHMKDLERHLGREIPRVHLPEFDYAGTPRADRGSAATRGRRSRTPTGFGSKNADDLTPEELAELLGKS